MNRRSFFGRLAAVAVGSAAVVQAKPQPVVTSGYLDSTGGRYVHCEITTTASPTTLRLQQSSDGVTWYEVNGRAIWG